MAKVRGGVNQTAAFKALIAHPLLTKNKRKSTAVFTRAPLAGRAIFKSLFHDELTSAFAASVEVTKQAAASWRALTEPQRDEWRTLAAQRVASSKINAKKSTTNENRRVSTRKATGFSMYLSEYHAAGKLPPKTPNDPTRGEPVQITELLTGGDYEQRVIQTIAETTGQVNICVYQASANWNQNGVAKTLLFAKLLALPGTGRTCRLILAKPLPGTAALTFNVQARAEMEAVGWQVRYSPPAPLLHAKFWLFEPFITILGSHNLSNRAITSNIETSILVNKESIYQNLINKFNEIWANGT